MRDRLRVERLRGDRRRKPFTYFTRSLKRGTECVRLRSRIRKLEATLQAYAKYGNKEAMERDIRLLNQK